MAVNPQSSRTRSLYVCLQFCRLHITVLASHRARHPPDPATAWFVLRHLGAWLATTYCSRRISSPYARPCRLARRSPRPWRARPQVSAITVMASLNFDKIVSSLSLMVSYISAVVPRPHNHAGWAPSAGSSNGVVGGVGSPWCMVGHSHLNSLVYTCTGI